MKFLIFILFIMVTNVYYSVSAFGTGDIKVACNISIVGGVGVATFSEPQTGNIGVGCRVISSNVDGFISEMTNSTTATIVSALGVAHGNVSSEALTSISHEYASLSAFEAGFTDANHINDTDLINADIKAHACCYYDHDNQTAMGSVTINWGGTVDATRHLKIFTPEGGTESINNQRHLGLWDGNKFFVEGSSVGIVRVQEGQTRVEGLQFFLNSSGNSRVGLYLDSIGDDSYVSKNIIKFSGTGTGCYGIRTNGDAGQSDYIFNNLVYGFSTTGSWGINISQNISEEGFIYNNTVYGCTVGIQSASSDATVINNVSAENGDDFFGTFTTIDFNASDDGDGTNAQTLSATRADDFADVTIDDYSIVSGSVCVENGADDPGSGLYSDDIVGIARSSAWDIGAFELVAVVGRTTKNTRAFPLGERIGMGFGMGRVA